MATDKAKRMNPPACAVYDTRRERRSRASANIPGRDIAREATAEITVCHYTDGCCGELTVRAGDDHWRLEGVPLDVMEALATLLPALFGQAVSDGTIAST